MYTKVLIQVLFYIMVSYDTTCIQTLYGPFCLRQERYRSINIHYCALGLAGILEKLDHFQYLNIKSVWIGPLYRSPMRDFGYDVEDFRAIDPVFGTMQDFEDLLAEMHNKGMYFHAVRGMYWFSSGVRDFLSASTRFESDHGFHSQSHQ